MTCQLFRRYHPWMGPVPVPARIFAAFIGTCLVIAGAVAVFVTTNSAGAASLVVAGIVIGAMGMFANRIESFEGGGFKIQLAANMLAKADEAERAGDAERAGILREEAQQLMSAVGPISADYDDLRRRKGSSRARTATMESLVRLTRDMAKGHVTPDSVEQLFHSGSDGDRITALGLMQGNTDLANTEVVIDAISRSRSAFEQYHALLVAEALVAQDPTSPDASKLRATVEQAVRSGRFGPGSDRSVVANRILASPGSAAAPPPSGA